METRTLAALLVSALNDVPAAITALLEKLEEALSEDPGEEAPARTKKKATKKKATSRRRAPDPDEEEEEEEEDDGDEEEEGEEDEYPSEAEIVKAARAALKTIGRAECLKLIKKHGKAARATEVHEEHRQAVIDALEKAMEE